MKLIKYAIFALAMLFGLSIPAFANHITTATVIPACGGYQIAINAALLTPGTQYTFVWAVDGYSTPQTGTVTFTASADTYAYVASPTITPPAAGALSFTGTATLVGQNTVNISFAPPTLNCPVPTPSPELYLQNNTDPWTVTEVLFTSPSAPSFWFNVNIAAFTGMIPLGTVPNESPCLRTVTLIATKAGKQVSATASKQMNICWQNEIVVSHGAGASPLVIIFKP